MKNTILIIALAFSFNLFAQPRGHERPKDFEKKREQIKAEKVAFLTEKLDLSSSEAEQFWPVYNKYEEKRGKLRKSQKALHKTMKDGLDNLSDQEIESKLMEGLSLKEKMVQLEKERYESLKEVLPIKKVATLYGSEKMFKKELIRKIKRPTEAPAPPAPPAPDDY
ncbi:MAG: hypothetical protein MRY83_02115 [Flavobacteriales bacterium]|nr:hypothetical protein [Flavobacteriales bacterium]